MSAQLTIDDYVEPSPPPSNRDKFLAFHAANPHVLDMIVAAALDKILCCGKTRGSVKNIVESLRWNPDFRTDTRGGEFKINNNFPAFYARLAMDTEPRLRGFFETKERKGE